MLAWEPSRLAEADIVTDRSGGAGFEYWVGLHPIDVLQPADMEELNEWYDTVHVPEVVDRNPGFTRGRRWQLVDPEPSGSRAPFWLAVYDIADQGNADGYLQRAAAGIAVSPPFTPPPPAWKKLEVRWRLLWRAFHSRGSCEDPQRLFLVGMDPMAGASTVERKDFDDFYSDVHVPEVMELLGFESGKRSRCHGTIAYPGDNGPEFCAAYESTDRTPMDRAGARGRLSEGPRAWQHRRVSWRLTYERLGGSRGPGGVTS